MTLQCTQCDTNIAFWSHASTHVSSHTEPMQLLTSRLVWAALSRGLPEQQPLAVMFEHACVEQPASNFSVQHLDIASICGCACVLPCSRAAAAWPPSLVPHRLAPTGHRRRDSPATNRSWDSWTCGMSSAVSLQVSSAEIIMEHCSPSHAATSDTGFSEGVGHLEGIVGRGAERQKGWR